jgi:hypothetical protein
MVEDAIVVGSAAAAGTAVTRLKLSTSTRASKILKAFLFTSISPY